jgi:hypothetical protein
MKPHVPATLEGVVSAARQDRTSLSSLSRLADQVEQRAAATAPSSLRRRLAPSRVVTVAALASAAAFGVFAATQVLGDRSPSVVTPGEIGSPSRPEPADTAARMPAPLATHSIDHEPAIPSIDVRSLPDPKTPPEMRKVGPEHVKAVLPEEASEDALLHRAHAASSSDPRQALALTAEHARRFPNGMLAHEREVLAIEALARLGRRDDARARATAFSASYPGSPYQSRVDDALGAPAVDTPSSMRAR